MDDSEENSPPIDKLPMEVWFKVIDQMWQFDRDEDILNTFYGLRLTCRLASAIARRPLEKVLSERFFVGLLLPQWTWPWHQGFFQPYDLITYTKLEKYVYSIERLPRRFQSSAIFRTTPAVPTKTLIHKPRIDDLELTRRIDQVLGGMVVTGLLDYIPEWCAGDATFLLLLMLKHKCKHFKVKAVHNKDQLVFWKERGDWKDKHEILIADEARRKQEAHQNEQRVLQHEESLIDQLFQPEYKEVQEREDWLRSNPLANEMACQPDHQSSGSHAGRSVDDKELSISHQDPPANVTIFHMLLEEGEDEAHGKTNVEKDTEDGSDDLGVTACPESCDVCAIKWNWSLSSG